MPQTDILSEYRDLSLEDLAQHPVKLGFEFEFASRRSHRDVGADMRRIFGDDAVGVVQDGYNAHNHRGYDKWQVTADSSIPTTPDASYRVELISPVMTAPGFKDSVEKVFAYLTERRAHTSTSAPNSSSTGMHITVSHPNVTADMSAFDALKFAVLINDIEMVSKYRGALDNRYAASLLSRFTKSHREFYNNKRIRQADVSIPWSGDPELLFILTTKEPNIRRALLESDKYRSINLTKTGAGLVEVRSPGGDYLSLGAEDAIEASRKILSALVYACSPTGGLAGYKERFVAMFDQYIKPKPKPILHDSPSSFTLTLTPFRGISIEIRFRCISNTREIDGWDMRQSRAVYVHSIVLKHSLPQPERANSIFSPVASGAREFHLTVAYGSVPSDTAFLEENWDSFPSMANPVCIENITTNASDLRGPVQLNEAKSLTDTFKRLLSSDAFKNEVILKLTRELTASLTPRVITRMLGHLFPVGDALTDRNNLMHGSHWTRIHSTLDNAIEAHARQAARHSTTQSASNFSATLQERLNHLRSSTGTNIGFVAAPTSTTTSVPMGGAMAAAPARSQERNGEAAAVLQGTHIGEAFASVLAQSVVTVNSPTPRPVTVHERLNDSVRFLMQFSEVLANHPADIQSLIRYVDSSRAVTRDLESRINSTAVTVPAEHIRTFSVADRQNFLNLNIKLAYLANTVVLNIERFSFESVTARRKLSSLLGMLKSKAVANLLSMESIRGQAALVHNPERIVQAIMQTAELLSIQSEMILQNLVAIHELSSLFRPTHVGRIRQSLMIALGHVVDPQPVLVGAESDAESDDPWLDD